MVIRALAPVSRRGFDPDLIDAGERLLAEHATQFGPKDLHRLAKQVVNAIDPDGTLPDEQLQSDRRFFRDAAHQGRRLRRQVPPHRGVRHQTVGSAAAVGQTPGQLHHHRDGKQVEEPDPRTFGQRMHDALAEVCDRLLRSNNAVPDSGGTPATVIINLDLADVLAKTGWAVASDGTLIKTDTALAAADQADLYWAVKDSAGQILHLGRTRRIASLPQTIALYARDRGCSFPGCDIPPEWCERHHVLSWAEGGLTDLNNLTLLCSYHHHNFLSKGWECRINHQGLPEWLPPWYIDRTRTPMINNRIRAAMAATEHRRR